MPTFYLYPLKGLKMLLQFAKKFLKGVWRFVRRHPWITAILVLTLTPILGVLFWALSPEDPEYVTEFAVRGNLQQTTEAVGTVVSDKDLKIKFPVTGVVSVVNVREGDSVTAGDILAELRNDALKADIQSAQARLSADSARLRELREGTRPEDIAIAEARVENKRASLEVARTTLQGAEDRLRTAEDKLDRLKREADTSLSGLVGTSQSTSRKELTTIRTSLQTVDDIFQANTLRNVLIQNANTQKSLIDRKYVLAEQGLNRANLLTSNSFGDYRDAIDSMISIRAAILDASDVVSDTYDLIANLALAGNLFDQAEKESKKSTLSTESKNAMNALSNVDAALRTLQDSAASFDTKIAAEENTVATALSTKNNALSDILTFETSLRTEEAELQKKRAGSRPTEIAAAQAQVNQSYADVNRAKARLEDTVLRAPFDGRITKVDMKEGEFTGDFDNFDYAISMLGSSPYRIEMYVAEIDIPKVQLTQSGSLELDAFPGELLPVRVSEIDPIATLRDGVPKYLVTLDFLQTVQNVRVGMTGDSVVYTDQREDVIVIPGRAVFTNDEGKKSVRILQKGEEVEERTVVLGIEGEGGDVEVISGLEEGEQIIILIRE